MPIVDLHIHTTASDGVNPPSEILRLASENSVSVVSITDHDTLDGIEEGITASSGSTVEFIPGIELSVDLTGYRQTAHLLGYFPGIDTGNLLRKDSSLGEAVAFVQGGRERRNPRILEKLRASGIYIKMSEVELIAGGDVVGRPHIAEAMVNEGYVGSLKEAFNRFLGKGKSAYVERDRLAVEDAMTVIREAGGLPVMAHPGYIDMDKDRMREFFRVMRDRGLSGIEVFYPTHSSAMVEFLRSCTADFDLFATGGTDYHGREGEGLSVGGSERGFRVDSSSVTDFLRYCGVGSNQEVTGG